MRAASAPEERFVADAAALAEAGAAFAGAARLALDTEFVRERTYYSELCLIQIAAADSIACIDCLAGLDEAALLAALTRPGTEWVLHSARQDLEVIWHRYGRLPPRLVDTQIAAALLGHSPQLGLQDLLARVLGVTLGKEHTRTDWTRRPLPPAALRYAYDDVRFLLPAWDALRGRLAELGRLEWFEEDCARALAQPLESDPAAILARTKGLAKLTFAGQCAAFALVAWREQRARESNRPRRWILPDEALVEISRRAPRDAAALGAIPGLGQRFVARSGAAVLAALASSGSEEIRTIVAGLGVDREPDRAQLKRLKANVEAQAETLGIQPEVLASRRDLVALATGSPTALTSGWRAAVLGTGEGPFEPPQPSPSAALRRS